MISAKIEMRQQAGRMVRALRRFFVLDVQCEPQESERSRSRGDLHLLRLSLPLLFCSVLAGLLSAQTSPSSSNPSLPGTPMSNLAATADESAVFDKLDNLVRYEDDGTGRRETIAVIRVQSQAGVQALGQLVF